MNASAKNTFNLTGWSSSLKVWNALNEEGMNPTG